VNPISKPENFPNCILLYDLQHPAMDAFRDFCNKSKIPFINLSNPVSLQQLDPDKEFSVAVAYINRQNPDGVAFLRAVMHWQNVIQRVIITDSVDLDLFREAINKAHVNYILSYPLDSTQAKEVLIKAHRRFRTLSRPLRKLDKFAEITQDLLIDNERIRDAARRDALTGLLNRRAFDDYLTSLWLRLKKDSQTLSIALIDLDHFKRVNDTYGHQVGDEVLKKVGRILLENQRIGIDNAFRYGGEEFAILSIHTNKLNMQAYMQRLLETVQNTVVETGQYQISFTFSSGIAEIQQANSVQHLVQLVDRALYQAKQNGRNQICLA
jgi:diguanylate cyclase (GGDEF)-like protein